MAKKILPIKAAVRESPCGLWLVAYLMPSRKDEPDAGDTEIARLRRCYHSSPDVQEAFRKFVEEALKSANRDIYGLESSETFTLNTSERN